MLTTFSNINLRTHTPHPNGLCVRRCFSRLILPLTLPRLLLILLLAALPFQLSAQIASVAPRHNALTMKEAKAWCDSISLHNPEGIYTCPDLRTIVLVKAVRGLRSNINPGYCEIICIESENINLAPGQVIGYLSPTADPNTISLILYEKITYKGISKPKEYAAKYHSMQGTISYERPKKKLRFHFNPLALIPKIGRMVRIVNNTTEHTVPSGFRRIYPEPTETGLGSPLFPKYF